MSVLDDSCKWTIRTFKIWYHKNAGWMRIKAWHEKRLALGWVIKENNIPASILQSGFTNQVSLKGISDILRHFKQDWKLVGATVPSSFGQIWWIFLVGMYLIKLCTCMYYSSLHIKEGFHTGSNHTCNDHSTFNKGEPTFASVTIAPAMISPTTERYIMRVIIVTIGLLVQGTVQVKRNASTNWPS